MHSIFGWRQFFVVVLMYYFFPMLGKGEIEDGEFDDDGYVDEI